MKTIFVIIASILLLSQNIDAQICDSLSVNDSLPKLNLSKTLIPDSAKHARTDKYHFRSRQLILPTILVGTGIMGLTSDWMEYQNHEMKDELRENIDKKITIDDFSQYAPFISVYALDLCGVKGEHNLRDYTAILATSYLLMGVTVNALKMCIREQRPDNSSFNSFPSGHTATAFMGAELLRHEFRHSFAMDWRGGLCSGGRHRIFPYVQQSSLVHGHTGWGRNRHSERQSVLLVISIYQQKTIQEKTQ
jgi:hypothetical protein